MFYSVFFSGLVYTMFFVYILHACFYSEVFLLLPTHTLIKKNYLHLLVLHKRWEVRAVRQRWHKHEDGRASQEQQDGLARWMPLRLALELSVELVLDVVEELEPVRRPFPV